MRLELRVGAAVVKLAAMGPPPARAALVVALVVCAPSGWAADERVIEYSRDALTVRLAKVPVTDVLGELGRQTGAEIRGQVRTPTDVTAEFEAVPLPEALHRLLGDQNFALIYGDGGRLKAVRLIGGAPGAPVAPAMPPALPPAQPAPGNLAALVARHDPIPVGGRLQEVVGAPSAGLQQLFDLSIRHEEATVRAEAMRALVATLEIEPALRQAVLGELNAIDDGALSNLLRGAAGEHAEEVAMQILTQARGSEIRVKASSVLQRLRAGS